MGLRDELHLKWANNHLSVNKPEPLRQQIPGRRRQEKERGKLGETQVDTLENLGPKLCKLRQAETEQTFPLRETARLPSAIQISPHSFLENFVISSDSSKMWLSFRCVRSSSLECIFCLGLIWVQKCSTHTTDQSRHRSTVPESQIEEDSRFAQIN